jgi:DNA-binding GntR family transcriptional regulator
MQEGLSEREGERLARRKSLGDEVFEILRDRILAGAYGLGEWLRQEEIARSLGVSQTPVREALDRLVTEGLAERVAFRGVRVVRLTDEEVADIYAARLVLEATVARAAANRTANRHVLLQQLEAMQQLVAEMERLEKLEEMARRRQLNSAFHLALAQASGNQALARLYEMTLHQFPDFMIYEGMFRQAEALEVRLARETAEHRAILEAVAAGEADLAAQRAKEHILNLRDELVGLLAVDEELLEEKAQDVSANQ